MGSTTRTQERGLWRAVTSLVQFSQSFKNWKEVWSAHRSGSTIPPLVLNSGMTLNHDPIDDPIASFRESFVERRFTSKKFYTPRCGDVVLDLGAQIGFFALSLQTMARGVRIHSFEPASDRRSRLKKNVTANRLNPFITVYPFIVGVAAASPQLQTAGQAGLRSLQGRPNSSFSMLEVLPTLSLSEAIDLTGAAEVDLLKIESAGNEISILESADPETWDKIRRIVVKYHEHLIPDARQQLITILESHGFPVVETLANRKDPCVGLIRAARER